MNIINNVISLLNSPVPFPSFLEREVDFNALFQLELSSVLKPAPGRTRRPGSLHSRATPRRKFAVRHPAQFRPAGEVKVLMTGPLQHGQSTAFALDGHDLMLSDMTWIFGTLQVGTVVTVKGISRIEGVECTSVVVKMP